MKFSQTLNLNEYCIKVNFATHKSEYASNKSIFKGIGLRFLQANEICEKFFSLLIEFIIFREVNMAVQSPNL